MHINTLLADVERLEASAEGTDHSECKKALANKDKLLKQVQADKKKLAK